MPSGRPRNYGIELDDFHKLVPEFILPQAQSALADFGAPISLAKVMFMVDTGLIIKSDRDGQPTLFFKTDAREILPPETHAERMEWVRSSFARFYSQIEENQDQNLGYAYQVKTAAALTRF
ncbi:MAG TPA: hypothetical protein PKZ32_13420 [Candidatus Melainabacteria bacterium]|nr:hypothetical protein [Candidatus Melainabacteria bacterium]